MWVYKMFHLSDAYASVAVCRMKRELKVCLLYLEKDTTFFFKRTTYCIPLIINVPLFINIQIENI